MEYVCFSSCFLFSVWNSYSGVREKSKLKASERKKKLRTSPKIRQCLPSSATVPLSKFRVRAPPGFAPIAASGSTCSRALITKQRNKSTCGTDQKHEKKKRTAATRAKGGEQCNMTLDKYAYKYKREYDYGGRPSKVCVLFEPIYQCLCAYGRAFGRVCASLCMHVCPSV